MARIHLLNVYPGDCTIIEHNSGRVTMIDICDGNLSQTLVTAAAQMPVRRGQQGGFRMGSLSTNPILYARWLGIESIFRFILTHPDMDHMDGFDALCEAFRIINYWDTGSRRDEPDFSNCPYLEADWDRYESVRDGRDGTKSLLKRARDIFEFANVRGGDGLHILAPDAQLVRDCNMNDDINDGSYALLYRTGSNRIILPGDAHDNTWAYIRQHRAASVGNASFLLAPHHGRDSDRSYDFLDLVRPSLTLIGCTPCEYIDYDQWNRRGLDYITSNQCGNVVLETGTTQYGDYLAVWVQNVDFAITKREPHEEVITNQQGYALLTTISARPEVATRPAA